MHKAPVAARDDPEFGNVARRSKSSTFVAHVRHGTSGGRRYENTHPFSQDKIVFAHNGALGHLDLVDEKPVDYRRVVHGATDSERVFALIVKETAAHREDLSAERGGRMSARRSGAGAVAELDCRDADRVVGIALPEYERAVTPRQERVATMATMHLHDVGQQRGIRVRSLTEASSSIVHPTTSSRRRADQTFSPSEHSHDIINVLISRRLGHFRTKPVRVPRTR